MISDDLLDVLERTWWAISCEYDVSAEMPEMQSLFDGADLVEPDRAAEIVVANMLMEVMECVGRFSPWYIMPGRAFGLLSIRNKATNRLQRILAPEAVQHWSPLLGPLATAIRRNVSVILATQVIDAAIENTRGVDPCVMARCVCVPPHIILINRSFLGGEQIVCERCREPFHEIESVS